MKIWRKKGIRKSSTNLQNTEKQSYGYNIKGWEGVYEWSLTWSSFEKFALTDRV